MSHVIDLGSWSTKIGIVYPTEEELELSQKPCKVFQENTFMGTPKYPESVAKTVEQIRTDEYVFGSDCWKRSAEYSVFPLIE